MAIMCVTWSYNRTKYKSVTVCGRMKGIGELFCTFVFDVVTTLWIGCAFFDFFRFFLIELIGRKRLFSMVFTVLINLFMKAFLISTCFFSNHFLFKFAFIRTGFYMCRINEDVLCTN